jgi:hypothetical protein
MDKTQAQQLLLRWRAVEEIRQQEARAATLELRWRQLNALYGLAKGLQLGPQPPDAMQGYERWAKLKENAAHHPTR